MIENHRIFSCLGKIPPSLPLSAPQVGELNAAEEALSVYTLQAKRYSLVGDAMASVEIRDQFVCRAAFARGLLIAERARSLKGPELVAATVEAIKHVLEGIATAQANDRHTFLLYNGSVHYWHVSRPLQRPGLRSHLGASLETVLKALERVGGQDEWRIRNMMNLAMCQFEAGNAAAALATAGSAAELAKAACPDLVVATLGLRAHLQNSGSGGDPNRPKSPKSEKAAPPPKAPAGGKAAAGAPPPPDVDHSAAALVAAQVVRTTASSGGAATDKAATERTLSEAWARVDPAGAARDPAASTKSVELGTVAELAWAAALADLPELASTAAARAAQSPSLPPRLRAQLAQEYVTLSRVPPRLTSDNVTARLACMKRLEPVLAALCRLGDAEAAQDATRLIWNAGLPLLQSNLRTKLARPFAAAVGALETFGSGLHRLRAAMHLELAGAYLADDLLAKASAHVAKGLALDYLATPEEVAWTGLPRPLDRFLAPLSRALALRGAIYEEPEAVEDQAVLLVEKAKEAGDNKVRASYLNQAIARLASLPDLSLAPGGLAGSTPPTPEGGGAAAATASAGKGGGGEKAPRPQSGRSKEAEAAAANDPGLVDRRVAAKQRVMLWAEIAKAARAAGLWALAHRVAPYVLRASPAPASGKGLDREVVMTQAELAFIDAECCIMMLQEAGVPLLPPPAGGWPAPAAGAPAAESAAAEWQGRASAGFQEGVRLGASVGQGWLVMNGAVYVWNHWLPEVLALRYSSLVPLLQPLVATMLELPDCGGGGGDPAVLYPLAHALACGLEHRFMEARAGGPADYRALLQATSAVSTDVSGKESPDLALGVDVCRRTAARAPPHQRRRMVATLARLLTLQGTPVARVEDAKGLDPEPAGQAVALVELLPKPEVPTARKLEALAAASALLASVVPPDVELWAKLAKGALALGEPAKAMECAQAALACVPPGMELSSEDVGSVVATLGAETWYWLALCAAAAGQGAAMLIQPDAQSRSTADALRRKALSFFTAAVRYGTFGGRRDVVDWAMRLYWNTARPFCASAVTRRVLYEDLEELLARMLEVGVGEAAGRRGITNGGVPLPEDLLADPEAVLDARLASQARGGGGGGIPL